MENALIVSHTKRSISFFVEMLQKFEIYNILTVTSSEKAVDELQKSTYDIIIINSPLPDTKGYELAVEIAKNEISQVIMIVSSELYDVVSEKMDIHGVITIGKPLNKNLFELAIKLAKVTQSRIKQFHKENTKLVQKIADIKIIERAKIILVSYFNMNEKEAHKYIEKQAMDTRKTKRNIAEELLKTYEL